MSEPEPSSPRSLGASSELAAAEEMPGCVVGFVKAVYLVPLFFFRELPTLPLDFLVLAHERGGKIGVTLYLVTVTVLVAAACWLL
ncbi:MAG TPA: hypothetical protein VJZ27_17630, partial [Aggregatilineales bacterium]|nr:hypothetical protein [Aggregatilineales bacterium]